MNTAVGAMQRRVRKLQKELGQLGPVMRGSVVVIGTRNKQPVNAGLKWLFFRRSERFFLLVFFP